MSFGVDLRHGERHGRVMYGSRTGREAQRTRRRMMATLPIRRCALDRRPLGYPALDNAEYEQDLFLLAWICMGSISPPSFRVWANARHRAALPSRNTTPCIPLLSPLASCLMCVVAVGPVRGHVIIAHHRLGALIAAVVRGLFCGLVISDAERNLPLPETWRGPHDVQATSACPH